MSKDNSELHIKGNGNLVSTLWKSMGLVIEVRKILSSTRQDTKTVRLIKEAFERRNLL